MRLLRTVESGTELIEVGMVPCPTLEMTLVVAHRVTTKLELMFGLLVRNVGRLWPCVMLRKWLA